MVRYSNNILNQVWRLSLTTAFTSARFNTLGYKQGDTHATAGGGAVLSGVGNLIFL